MKIHFTLREVFLFTAVVALAIPYVLGLFFTKGSPAIDVAQVEEILSQVEPKGRVLDARMSLNSFYYTFSVPSESSSRLIDGIRAKIRDLLASSGWTVVASEYVGGGNGLANFSFHASRGGKRAGVHFVMIDHEPLPAGDLAKFRFMIVCPPAD
jgi:hypothetical protein